MVEQGNESTNGVRETSKLGGIGLFWLFRIGVFTWFNCELVTTRDISIEGVWEIGESTNGVWETWKLGETKLILLFPIGVFTWFNYGLVTIQENSMMRMPQIGEFASGVRETWKLDGTKLIALFLVGVFTWFNCEVVTTQDISIVGCNKLENLPMEFEKLQSLVELDLSGCSQLGCLLDSIVDLS
jgi:hypothetical protein